MQQDRAKTIKEMVEKSVIFYQNYEAFDEKAAQKNLKPAAIEPLVQLKAGFAALEDWEKEPLHQVVLQVAETLDLKLGKVAQPLRVALTGTTISPSIDATLYLLGREKSLANIDRALDYIHANHGATET